MKKAVTLILLTICYLNGYSQQTWFSFNNLSEKDGLADANIAAVIKDHRGFMWFASSSGLNCYNGISCKVYQHLNTDSNSLSDDNVNTIFEDHNKNIWVGTRNGLNLYDSINDNFIHFFHNEKNPASISSNEIWSIAADKSQTIWIGTMGGGLNKLIQNKTKPEISNEYNFIRFEYDSLNKNSISSNIIWSIAFDKNGYGWLGTENGLNRFKTEDAASNIVSFDNYIKSSDENSITDNSIWKVYVDADNNIWLLSFYGMLDCLLAEDINLKKDETDFIHVLPVLNRKFKLDNFVILSLLRGTDHCYWAGTDKQGLLHFTIRFNKIQHTADIDFAEHFLFDDKDNESLINNAVYSLTEDEEGILWIGTANGISKYIHQKNAFNSLEFNKEALIRNSSVGALYAEKDNVWFTNKENTIWLFNTTFKQPRLFARLNNFFEFTDLYRTENGDLLAGTSGTGIFRASKAQIDKFIFQNQTPVSLKPISGDANIIEASIFSISEFAPDRLLAGGFGRLGTIDLNTGNYTSLIPENLNADNLVFRCAVKKDATWFIGSDRGLYTLNNHQLELLKPITGKLNSDRIISLFASETDVWIGTISGLNVFNLLTKSVTNYSTANGLPDNTVRSIASDDAGNIWIATRNGLCCYNKKTALFSLFNENESLNTNQLTALAFNNHYLFIGGDKGINTVIPASLNALKSQFKIAITDFRIAGNSVFTNPVSENGMNIKKQLPVYIKWNENNISIVFTALDYKNPEAIQYAYLLEGFDKDWVFNGKENTANYTNLPGGKYTFRIKYQGSDGIWRQSPAMLNLSVSTAWFKSWWFYALCTITVVALLYTFYRIRLTRILEMQKIRNKIARDLHDDIGSTLSTINILSGNASKKINIDTVKTTEMLQKIGDSSRKMMDAMGDIVWSINPDNDVLENMAVRMREYAAQILEAKEIEYKININEAVMNLKLPIDKRRDFYLIFKEAINNLAKYSEATKANVELSFSGNLLKLQVTDNGKGFDSDSASTGNGLKNMKQRTENIRGKLSLVSQPDKGTSITLAVPFT